MELPEEFKAAGDEDGEVEVVEEEEQAGAGGWMRGKGWVDEGQGWRRRSRQAQVGG